MIFFKVTSSRIFYTVFQQNQLSLALPRVSLIEHTLLVGDYGNANTIKRYRFSRQVCERGNFIIESALYIIIQSLSKIFHHSFFFLELKKNCNIFRYREIHK